MRRVLLLGSLVLTVAVAAAAVRADAGERKPRLVRVVSGWKSRSTRNAQRGARAHLRRRAGRADSGRRQRTDLATPFADLRRVVNTVGYRGLLSMVFHPRFPVDPQFFVHYVGRGNDAYVDNCARQERARGACVSPHGAAGRRAPGRVEPLRRSGRLRA